jgi:hypothetical protein
VSDARELGVPSCECIYSQWLQTLNIHSILQNLNSHGSDQVNSALHVYARVQVVIIISTSAIHLQLISVNSARMRKRSTAASV